MWPKTFKEAFCEAFNCPPEQYERALFWRGLYRHALPLAALIYRIDPEVFREDFDLIREIGNAHGPDLFETELDYFHGRNVRDNGWIRGTLLIRVSGKRLLRIKRQVFRE